jgi:hypothetical protein
MKTLKISYWTTTGIFSAMMLLSGFMYFTSPEVEKSFVHLGFPNYFRIELGIAKFLGAAILIIPIISSRLKEWAYAGFGITLISACTAHLASVDPASTWITTLVVLAILATSYITYHKLHDVK